MCSSKTKTLFFVVVTIMVVGNSAAPKQLPSYIKPCREDDPNLNKCAFESAKNAIPALIKGDKKYNIPSLNPLIIDRAEVPGTGLDLVFTNAKLYGIETAILKDIKLDTKNFHVEISLSVPHLTADTHYKVDGKILVLPIKGEGKANITLVDSDFVYIDDYVKEKGPDGEEYLKVINPRFKYNIGKAYFHLDNLFNGDKTLSEATHTFLNENWQDVVKEMAPPITETVKLIGTQILTNIFSTTPYKNIWAH